MVDIFHLSPGKTGRTITLRRSYDYPRFRPKRIQQDEKADVRRCRGSHPLPAPDSQWLELSTEPGKHAACSSLDIFHFRVSGKSQKVALQIYACLLDDREPDVDHG
jgi:hypothetical protein